MQPHRVLTLLRCHRLLLLRLVAPSLFFILCAPASSKAQTTEDKQSFPSEQQRVFENTMPARAPLKVKLKNEQAFTDMRNRNWARELEIEFKNTGDKPIYFFYMNLVMPDVIVGSYPLAFQISYGRKEFVHLTTPIQPGDVPLRPGEEVTLKIEEVQLRGYEKSRDADGWSDPKTVSLHLQLINFGDGTSLRGTDAHPFPKPKPSN